MIVRCWTSKDARQVLNWARTPIESRAALQDMARALDRTPEAVQEFLRRMLPRGQRPWHENRAGGALRSRHWRKAGRSTRHPKWRSGSTNSGDGGRSPIAMAETMWCSRSSRSPISRDVARDCVSALEARPPATLQEGSGGVVVSPVAAVSTGVRSAREIVAEQREWLALNGYEDPEIEVKMPSVRGLLK